MFAWQFESPMCITLPTYRISLTFVTVDYCYLSSDGTSHRRPWDIWMERGPFGPSCLVHRTENMPLKDDKRLCKWQCYDVAISYNLVETSYRLKSFLREYGRITKLIFWRKLGVHVSQSPCGAASVSYKPFCCKTYASHKH